MRIAFLGTGLLGSGFIHHLLSTTGSVTVWNRTPARAQGVVDAGAQLAATPADAARDAERIHLCLKDDASVDAVLDALLPEIAPDTVVIDHTTTSAAGAAARGARFAAAGRGFLHAPVFMSPGMAKLGKGIMLAAGPQDVFARVDGALAAMTGDLWYVGPDLRKAAGLKLVGNATLIAITGAIADTLAVGKGLGLSSADVNEVLTRLNPGASIGIRGKRMATGDFTASFELAMARKDVGLMLDAVGDAPLAVLRSIAARSDQLIADGHGAADLGVLALDAVEGRMR